VGKPIDVAIIGCGIISAQYLATLERLQWLRLSAVADIDPSRARAIADARDGVHALSVDALLADPNIEVVLNLTIPAAHAGVALKVIAAGKHVYGEKPLAATTAEARMVLDAATASGVRVGCAPDTVLGTGIQTARHAVDNDVIGRPISATATMMTPGHERWHPNPDFYYAPGGGPLLDMGPYYITALVTLLGPVTSVIGAGSHLRTQRTIGSGSRAGEIIPVTVYTHTTGVLRHASGALSTLVMSFDALATRASNIEVHGERGSLIVPDPNVFDGEVHARGLGDSEWRALPVSAGYVNASRGYGLADLMLTASGTDPRAGGRLAYHVLDIMESFLASAETGQAVNVESSCERPAAVPLTSVFLPPAAASILGVPE
jgi:predicted dehydrogenase